MTAQMTKPVELTKAEWALMQCLWQRGRASATELQKLLADQQGWAYSTVKTMLDRMVEKGVLTAEREGMFTSTFPSCVDSLPSVAS